MGGVEGSIETAAPGRRAQCVPPSPDVLQRPGRTPVQHFGSTSPACLHRTIARPHPETTQSPCRPTTRLRLASDLEACRSFARWYGELAASHRSHGFSSSLRVLAPAVSQSLTAKPEYAEYSSSAALTKNEVIGCPWTQKWICGAAVSCCDAQGF